MSILFITVQFILIAIGLQFVIAPFIIRLKLAHPASPEFEPINIHQLPPDVADNFGRFIYAMSFDGFMFRGYFRQLAYMKGLGFFLVFLKNPGTGDVTYLLETFADNGPVPMRFSQVEFSTDFSNGVEVLSNNGQQAVPHKAVPELKLFRFPEVHNPRVLYQLHRRLCARHAQGAESIIPADGAETFLLSYGTVKEVRRQAEFGYYYLDEKADLFRLTLKGAFLMTWKMAWPVGSLRKALMKSRARATMRSLGF
ncbi:MAG TPA: hypothetical protein VF791_03070 [Pyrinomonadaceae bacterium]